MNQRTESRKVQFAAALLTAFAAFLVYAAAMRNGFAYDDVVIVSGDPRVTQFQFGPILSKPYWTSPGFALYRPVVTLSFAVDWAVSHGSAAWFHAMNGLWHAAATVCVFLLLLTWFTTPPAIVGALLFAVHPVHVEAVANVVGRAELMAAVFFLLACCIWAWQRPANRWFRLGLVLLLYLLALLCKESAATLPAVLVLIDAANGRWKRIVEVPGYLVKLVPEFAALTAVLAGALALRTAIGGAFSPTQLDPVLEVLTGPTHRIFTALPIWPEYLRLLLFPKTLLADYGPRIFMPEDGLSAAGILGILIIAALVLGGLWLLDRGRGLSALTLLWLPVTILPVANLLMPIGILLAERTLYLPSVVVSLGGALLAVRLRALDVRQRNLQRAAAFALIVVLALGAARIGTRIPDWKSTDTILLAQMRDRPDSFRAHWHAARIERSRKNADQALRHFAEALQLWPYRERLVVEAAGYASAESRVAQALTWARYGAQRWPANFQLQRLLAANALDAGDSTTARRALAAGLELSPNDTMLNQMSRLLLPGTHLQKRR